MFTSLYFAGTTHCGWQFFERNSSIYIQDGITTPFWCCKTKEELMCKLIAKHGEETGLKAYASITQELLCNHPLSFGTGSQFDNYNLHFSKFPM